MARSKPATARRSSEVGRDYSISDVGTERYAGKERGTVKRSCAKCKALWIVDGKYGCRLAFQQEDDPDGTIKPAVKCHKPTTDDELQDWLDIMEAERG